MVFLSSCCSVGSRLNGATLINEGLFKNSSNPLKTSGLIPESCPQAYSPHPDWSLWCLTKCCWQTCQHCLRCIFTYINCIKLLLLHQAVFWPCFMPKLEELLGTRPCTPDLCETLSVTHTVSPQVRLQCHCSQAHTAARKQNRIFNIPETVTASSPFMAFLEYSSYSMVCTKHCVWDVNSPSADSMGYSCTERNTWLPT